MRSVINISVTPSQKKKIEYEVKSGGYNSTSEFLRMLIREWSKRQELLLDIKASEKELQGGKGKKLGSLMDLIGVLIR